jgi:non-ribosomal peptide synthase protein (TIGR01720 family)
VLSARTSTALQRQTANLVGYLEQHPDVNLADVAYTLQVGRRGFGHRRVLLCRGVQDAIAALKTQDPERILTHFQETKDRPVAFVFSGASELSVGVGLNLYQGEPAFREQVNACAEVLGSLLDVDLRELLFPHAERAEQAAMCLAEPVCGRAALFALERALAGLWMSWGIAPRVVAGDGVGEYVAACVAGVLSLEDGLRLATGNGGVSRDGLGTPLVPFISSATGDLIGAGEAGNAGYWNERAGQETRLDKALGRLLEKPEQVLLEVGPGQALARRVEEHPDGAERQVVLSSLSRTGEGGQADLESLLATLGRLWLAGVAVDWYAFHRHERRHRLVLPTYPFERKRYWIEPAGKGARPENLLTSRIPDLADWFYIPSWRRSLSPDGSRVAGEGTCWLLLGDGCGLGARLAERLEAGGQRVMMVQAGPRFSGLDEGTCVIDPLRRGDYDALVSELDAAGGLPRAVVHLWGVTQDEPADGASGAPGTGFYSLVFLAQALAGRAANGVLPVTVVTNGIQAVTAGDALQPEKALALGAVRVLPQEYAHIACRCVDVVLPAPGTWQEQALVDQLWAELTGNCEDAMVAYRGRQRWVQAFEPVRLDVAVKTSSRLREQGVYAILGGGDGIGAVLAEHLALKFAARLVLIQEPGSAVPRLDGLDARDGVLVVVADVTMPDQVEGALARAEEQFGRLDGVIYAADGRGKMPFRPAADIVRNECEEWFRVPVHGLQALAEVLSTRELDFCLVTSSLSSVLGGPGLAARAAVNGFADAFAHQADCTGATPWLSVNWDRWRYPGMSDDEAAFVAHSDELSIAPAEGAEAFERILSCRNASRLVVSTVALQVRLDRWVQLEPLRESERAKDRSAPLHPRPNLHTPYVAPRSEAERTLARIWQELIGVEQVGVHDSFVELGGDSLLGIQVIGRANEAGLRLTPQQFFRRQTIAELAAVDGQAAVQAEQGTVVGDVPLTVSQHWFFDHGFSNPHRYNSATLFEVLRQVDPAHVACAVAGLIEHHDGLRARFVQEGTVWRQSIVGVGESGEVPFACVDLSNVPVGGCTSAVEQAADQIQGCLHVSRGPLLQVAFFDLGAGRTGRLLIVAHHLVVDGPSLQIVLEDLQAACRQVADGGRVQLLPKTTSLKRWSERLTDFSRSDALREELDYWLSLPWSDIPPLPLDYPENRHLNTWGSMRSAVGRLNVEETDVLVRQVPKTYGAQLVDVLLMALLDAVTSWTGGRWLACKVVDSGRHVLADADLDLSRTVGWITTTRAVVLQRKKVRDPGESLQSVCDQLRRIPNRGLGYDLLLRCGGDSAVVEQLKRLDFDLRINYTGHHQGSGADGGDLFAVAFEPAGDWQSAQNRYPYLLGCAALIVGGRLTVRWLYSEHLYERATVERVPRDFVEALRGLVSHCRARSARAEEAARPLEGAS